MKLKPEREDILSQGVAPEEYRLALVHAGGMNPYGEPNFRISVAENTRFFQGGNWHEWPEGTKLQSRGSMMFDAEGRSMRAPESKPLRIVSEMRWVRRYPALKGWIFQEWFPAHHYGDPADWAKHKVEGHPTLCRLGPFPEEGDYELALPFGWMQPASEEVRANDARFQGRPGLPTFSAIRFAVNYAEHCREFWAKLTPANRIRMRENQMLEQQALREKWEHDRAIAIIRDQMSPLWSNSLEAGRWRTALADKAGLKIGHVGS